jgi:hypothetical protein
MFKFIDWWIRFTLRSFVWGAHGALIVSAVATINLVRERNYWPALTFGLCTIVVALFLIAWWRGKLLRPNANREKREHE